MHGSDLILGFFENLVEKIDRYQRVEKPKAETPIDENEIQIKLTNSNIYFRDW